MAPGCDLGWHPRSPRFVHVRRDARSQIGKRSGRREIVVADQFVLGAEQVDGRWIWDNPAERAHRIVAAPPEICPPTPAELRSLLDFVADRDPLLQVFRFTAVTAVTGARRAQLLGLRWRSIDLERARISFYRGWVEGPDGPVLTSTKTKRAHSVDIDPLSFAVLERLHRSLSVPPTPDTYLFTTTAVSPHGSRTV